MYLYQTLKKKRVDDTKTTRKSMKNNDLDIPASRTIEMLQDSITAYFFFNNRNRAANSFLEHIIFFSLNIFCTL